MRRVLASLLVFVMTFALVVRGVAAPLMHLHPDMPAPTAAVSVQAHDHADCGEATPSDAVDDSVAAHMHADPTKDKTPFDHGKVCDGNGACCGPLVLSDSSDGVFGLVPLPEPLHIAVGAGIKPLDPDRPPSPSIA